MYMYVSRGGWLTRDLIVLYLIVCCSTHIYMLSVIPGHVIYLSALHIYNLITLCIFIMSN